MCQFYSSLCCPVLQQPKKASVRFYSQQCSRLCCLCMDAYVNQEPILPLDESVLKQPVLPGQVFSKEAYAASARICSKAACAVPEDGLQKPVVHLDCQSTRGSAAPRCVCLQELWCAPEVSVDYIEPVLHLCVSVCKIFVLHLKVSVFKSLCCTCSMCMSVYPELCAAPLLICLQEFCAAPGRVCLQTRVQCMLYLEEHSSHTFFVVCFVFFRNRFVCFGCFDTCSKHRNKPKNIFFSFMKQTEKQPKQIVFRFFSVKIENIFCLFRGHPTGTVLFSMIEPATLIFVDLDVEGP